MSESPLAPPQEVPEEVSDFVRGTISPIFSTHMGGLLVAGIEGSRVSLRFTRSCAGCYFRRSCIDGVIQPMLEQKFGSKYEFTIR